MARQRTIPLLTTTPRGAESGIPHAIRVLRRGPMEADGDSRVQHPQPLTATAAVGSANRRPPAVVPKTYTTRAGALMLFSEDAVDGRSTGFEGHEGGATRRNEECYVTEHDNGLLSSVEGLAWAALSYGGKVSVLFGICTRRPVDYTGLLAGYQ